MKNIQTSGQRAIRVMIVDDQWAIIGGIQRLIESRLPRMEVVATATTCAELLDTVATANPDIIVLGLDQNGKIATDAIKDIHRLTSIPILVFAGIRDLDIRQAAIINGARGVVGKEERADLLLRAIECVHDGEIWLNRRLMGKLLRDLSPGIIGEPEVNPEATRIASLTRREREVVQQVVLHRGGKSLEIADAINISQHTLRNHLSGIYVKLNVRNRLDLFAYAMDHRLAAKCP